MPPRASSNDPNVIAFRVVQESTRDPAESVTESPASTAARALGALGASKGGKARAKALTKAERVKIAQKGAKARWKK
jgi:hypothetical protein